MQRLAELQTRIASIEELLGIVGAMRSLAAARVQQARKALEGVRTYGAAVRDAVASGVSLLAPAEAEARPGGPGGTPSLVVFCSEHGFAGAFNDRLLARARAVVAESGGRACVIGSRGAVLAADHGLDPSWTLPMATHPDGILETTRAAADEIYRRIGLGETTAVDMLFTRYDPGGRWRIVRQRLLPLDLGIFREAADGAAPPPLRNLPAQFLVEKLVGEFVLAELTGAAMESYASENEARLRAMQAAHQNIEDRLDDMRRTERRLRQEQITTEMLDVVTGARALLEDEA